MDQNRTDILDISESRCLSRKNDKMVLMQMKHSIKIYLLTAILLLLLSCDGKFVIVNCDDCTTDEPKTINLALSFEPETGNAVQVDVYKGVIEDNILLDSFTTTSISYTYNVDINVRYTFTAKYENISFSGKTIVVVATVYPRVRYEKSQCENNCYYVYDKKVNLRVKYH